jgi:hypothetical protein
MRMRIMYNSYNQKKFVIETSYETGGGREIQKITIDKDNLYNFILRAKHLLLEEHGEEYRIKSKDKVKKQNKFENIDI